MKIPKPTRRMARTAALPQQRPARPAPTPPLSGFTLSSSGSLVLAVEVVIVLATVVLPQLHVPVYNVVGVCYGLLRLYAATMRERQSAVPPEVDAAVHHTMRFRYLSHVAMPLYKLLLLPRAAAPYLLWGDIVAHLGSAVLWACRFVLVPMAKRRRWGAGFVWWADVGVQRAFCEAWGFKAALYVLRALATGNAALGAEATAELLATNSVWLGLLGLATKSPARLAVLTSIYSALKVCRYAGLYKA